VAATTVSASSALELDDIQALAVTSWKRLQHAAYLFVTFDPAGSVAARKAWLARVVDAVSPASHVPPRDVDAGTDAAPRPGGPPRVQLALTATGMRALGATDAEMHGFADEAKQGMAARARILGDGEDPASERWELGAKGKPRIDALIACYAETAPALDELVRHHTSGVVAAGATVVDERTTWIGKREHFGYADGISQPIIAGTRDGADPSHVVPAGEILLGYHNAYNRMPRGPRGAIDLGRNGSYLVVRKLEQDVVAFWSYFASEARALLGCGHGPGPDCTDAQLDAWIDWLAAKVVGRWRSGASLVASPDHDDASKANPETVNRYDYRDKDLHGELCPIGSHVRRANPRDARDGSTAEESRLVVRRHRLLRRGRSWGPPLDREAALQGKRDGQRRGLMFMCLQASIARGFEFVQQTWLSNMGFGGLAREGDPLMGGEVDPRGAPHSTFTIPVQPVRIRLHGIPRFVTTLGGEYFFMPSMTALRHLAEM
jgi:Dyp-type peroxidase family